MINNKFKKDKRGAITDVIMWIVVAIVVVIVLGLFYYAFGMKVLPALKDGFQHFQNVNGQNITAQTNLVIDTIVKGMGEFKWIAYGILIVMALNIWLGYFLVRIHPAFFILYFLVAIVGFIISIPVSNGYEVLINSNSEFASVLQTQFHSASFIILNLPIFAIVISFIGMIILMAGIPRDRGAGGGPTP